MRGGYFSKKKIDREYARVKENRSRVDSAFQALAARGLQE